MDPGACSPKKILKTRTPQMLFPAFWRVNFKQRSTAKMTKEIAKLVIYSNYFLMLGIKFHVKQNNLLSMPNPLCVVSVGFFTNDKSNQIM